MTSIALTTDLQGGRIAIQPIRVVALRAWEPSKFDGS